MFLLLIHGIIVTDPRGKKKKKRQWTVILILILTIMSHQVEDKEGK